MSFATLIMLTTGLNFTSSCMLIYSAILMRRAARLNSETVGIIRTIGRFPAP